MADAHLNGSREGGYCDFTQDLLAALPRLYRVSNFELFSPYVHGKVASSWLHGDDGVAHRIGARELHVWWNSYEGLEINPLISVLEQVFHTFTLHTS